MSEKATATGAMKLYVWTSPYSVDCGYSMVFAVAETLAEAKKQAAVGDAYSCDFKYPRSDFAQRLEFVELAAKLGEPDRVLELPCAEWHEWSE